MNEVELQFEERGINRFGIVLYSKKDTLDFIKECKSQGVGILGLDGFIISELTTQPSMEDSVDYSTQSPDALSWERALEFVESRKDDIYFEIVC